MKASRRGFLAALGLAPLVGRFLPKGWAVENGCPGIAAPLVAPIHGLRNLTDDGTQMCYLSWYDERTGRETPVTLPENWGAGYLPGGKWGERPKGAA